MKIKSFFTVGLLLLIGITGYTQTDEVRLDNTKKMMKSIFNQDEAKAISWLQKGVLIDGDTPDANPLINAIYYQMPNLIAALIDKGANISAKNKDGDYPLMAAAYQADIKTMTLLFEKKANPFQKNNGGYNSFDYAVYSKKFVGMRHLLFSYLKTKKEASTDYLEELKSALIFQALLFGDTDYYFGLIDQLKIQPETTFFTNLSPLDISLIIRNDTLTRGIIERGISVSKPNKMGKLPIQFVSNNRQKTTYTFLLKKMLEEKAKTDNEKKILTQLDKPVIKARKLKNLSADFQKLIMEYAMTTGKEKTVAQLLKAGLDVNGQNIQGFHFLSIAVQLKNREMVKTLLDSGADIHVQNDNTYKTTAFMEAASANDVEMGKLLLQHGARINFGDINNDPALNYAVYYGNFNFVKYLLEHNADFTMKGQSGYTALMTAKAHNYTKIIEMLKKFGAKE